MNIGLTKPNFRKRKLEVPPDPRAHFERRSEFIESIFTQPCLSEMEKFFVANRKNKTPIWTETLLNQKLDEVSWLGSLVGILWLGWAFQRSSNLAAGKYCIISSGKCEVPICFH